MKVVNADKFMREIDETLVELQSRFESTKDYKFLYAAQALSIILMYLKDKAVELDMDKIIEVLELHSFELGSDTLPVHYVKLGDAVDIIKSEVMDKCD